MKKVPQDYQFEVEEELLVICFSHNLNNKEVHCQDIQNLDLR